MKSFNCWLAAVMASLLAVCAHAQSVNVKALAADMKQGGYVIVFRHGATNRDQAETDPLNPDNGARQRPVSGQGGAGWPAAGGRLDQRCMWQLKQSNRLTKEPGNDDDKT